MVVLERELLKLMLIEKEKEMEQTYFLTKKKLRKRERIVKRKDCLKTASSCNMNIVDDLTLRKRN